jgi:protein-tyrosine phosphatase
LNRRTSPSGRTDIHVHILPAIDDGPADMDESLALARRAVADGTSCVIATPHVDRIEVLDVAEHVADLRSTLAAEGVALEVLPGGELNVADLWALDERRLAAIAQGPPGARWILLEPPWKGDADETVAAAAELAARGYGAVIAHPERSEPLWSSDDAITRLTSDGACLQVTAASLLLGAHHPVGARAWQIVRGEELAVLASDAHDANSRPPDLAFAATALAEAGLPWPRITTLFPAGQRRGCAVSAPRLGDASAARSTSRSG